MTTEPPYRDDYQQAYLEGRLTRYYQPDAEHMPDDLCSFEVFGSLQNGMQCYPGVPEENWICFDCTGELEPIEQPVFRD